MKISVIIPCHNAEAYVGQTIGSVLEQSRRPDEIIVVDDASTDASLAVIQAFGLHVRLLSTRQGNAADTRAFGYDHAGGDAVLFLDADDVLGPTVLENLERELRRYPGSVVSCPWFRLELVDGKWVRRPLSCPPRRKNEDPLMAWLRGWYHPTSTIMWSREAYERAGGWDARGGNNDDGYLMMRALIKGVPLHISENGEAFYRRLPEGVATLSGQRFSEKGLRDRIFILEDIARLLNERGQLPRYRRILDEALKSIAVDCKPPNQGLIQVCAENRNRFGRKRWERLLHGTIHWATEARKRGRDEREELKSPPDSSDLEVISYGMATAKTVLANAQIPSETQETCP